MKNPLGIFETGSQSAITLLIAATLGSLLSPAFTIAAEVSNADRPLAGDWDLNPRQAWAVSAIDDEQFGRPAELRVMKDGTVFFHDFQQHISHILDRDGTFVASFAPQGEATGQVRRYQNCFIAGNEVVIGTPWALHFFTREGEFIESFPNNIFQRFPLAFPGGRTMLCAPGELNHVPDGKVRIERIDLTSGDESIFAEMSIVAGEEEGAGGPALVVRGLTPVVEGAFDPGSRRIYYGYTPDYRLHVAGTTGEQLFTFGLDREPATISAEQKRAHFEEVSFPEEHLDAIIGALPDRLASFRSVQTDSELIFVFPSISIEHKVDHHPVDIFSPDGRYLHRADVRLGDGLRFSPGNVVFAGGDLYIIAEDTEGRRAVARYEITLP